MAATVEVRFHLLAEIRDWFASEAATRDPLLQLWVDRIDGALEDGGDLTALEITRALNAVRRNGELVSVEDVGRALKLAASGTPL